METTTNCFYDQGPSSHRKEYVQLQLQKGGIPGIEMDSDQTVIRESQSCPGNRAICVFYYSVAVVQNVQNVKQQWVPELSVFDFEIKYRPGPTNHNADALSCKLRSQSISSLFPGLKVPHEVHEQTKDMPQVAHAVTTTCQAIDITCHTLVYFVIFFYVSFITHILSLFRCFTSCLCALHRESVAQLHRISASQCHWAATSSVWYPVDSPATPFPGPQSVVWLTLVLVSQSATQPTPVPGSQLAAWLKLVPDP